MLQLIQTIGLIVTFQSLCLRRCHAIINCVAERIAPLFNSIIYKYFALYFESTTLKDLQDTDRNVTTVPGLPYMPITFLSCLCLLVQANHQKVTEDYLLDAQYTSNHSQYIYKQIITKH